MSPTLLLLLGMVGASPQTYAQHGRAPQELSWLLGRWERGGPGRLSRELIWTAEAEGLRGTLDWLDVSGKRINLAVFLIVGTKGALAMSWRRSAATHERHPTAADYQGAPYEDPKQGLLFIRKGPSRSAPLEIVFRLIDGKLVLSEHRPKGRGLWSTEEFERPKSDVTN